MQNEEFDFQVLECVTKALDSWGSAVRDKIFWHLFFYCGMKPSEIGEKVDTFAKALEDAFGSDSIEIEKSIAIELKRKFGISKAVPSRLIPVVSAISSKLVVV